MIDRVDRAFLIAMVKTGLMRLTSEGEYEPTLLGEQIFEAVMSHGVCITEPFYFRVESIIVESDTKCCPKKCTKECLVQKTMQ